MEHHVSAATDVAERASRYYKRGGGWPVCVSAELMREVVVVVVVKRGGSEGKLGSASGRGARQVWCVVGGVSDRLVTTTRCTNTRLHCTRVMEVLMGGGEAVVGQTDKTVVGNGAH